MATLTEIKGLYGNGDMINKVQAAVAIVAYTISTDGDDGAPFDQTAGAHELRVEWANRALQATASEAGNIWKLILGMNNAASLGAITGATDAAIIANVESAVDLRASILTGA